MFLSFVLEGLQKGVVALASNCIGARMEDRISILVRSVVKITICISLFTIVPFIVFPEQIFKLCFDIVNFDALPNCQLVLIVQWISFSVITFSLSGLIGVLKAGGDANFVTMIRISSFFVCVIIPVIISSYLGVMTTLMSWSLGMVNIFVTTSCYWLRYKSGRWKRRLV
jgi:MATE family multidrug resistance protein